ncbi:MAG TPA: AMP-binding protein [Stellaceae bacterium]|nr:AMP-binding protein [Stellaceae bacterium]
MLEAYPLVAHAAGRPIFMREGGRIVTVEAFLDDVAAICTLLPSASYVVNLCADRYSFTVGFAAALMRGQVTILPPSEAPEQLAGLAGDYQDLYFLHDPDTPVPSGQKAIAFPTDRPPAPLRPVAGRRPSFPADQLAAILFTSGSTGKPLAQPRRWGALVRSARAAGHAMGFDRAPGMTLIGTVPHQHSYGLESIVMLALQHGHIIHDSRLLLPADIMAALASIGTPKILVTTPIHLRSMVADGDVLPRLDGIISATAPLDIELCRQAEVCFGTSLFEIYGCSEIGQIAMRRTSETAVWSCLDGIRLEAVGDDVWASGAAAANRAPLNDIIELRSPTEFLLRGRKSDMVNIAGKRSSLRFLNHQINSIEGVEDAVFVLHPAANRDRLAAYVVAPRLTAEQVLEALRRLIDPAFLPRPLHLVEALPRNALGKVTRDALDILVANAP